MRARYVLRGLAALLALAAVALAQGVPFGPSPTHQASKQGGEAFTPASLADLWAWYDASTFTTDGSTKDGSNNVTKWVNKEGTTARDLTGVGGTPIWTDDAVNSLDAIDFEVSDAADVLYRDVTFPSPPFHVFVVARHENVNANNRTLWWAGTAANNGDVFWDLSLNGSPSVLRWRVDVSGNAPTAISTTENLAGATNYLHIARETSNVSRGVTLDEGTEATGTTAKAPTADRFSVGGEADGTPGAWTDGFVCEMVICDAIVSGADYDNLLAYLDAKWAIPGVTTLPPLGPSSPLPWPLLLFAAALACLAADAFRRPRKPAGRVLRFAPASPARLAA